MNFDITLLFIAAVAQLRTAYLGYYINLHPPQLLETKRKNKKSFVTAVTIGFAALMWSGIRNIDAQNEMKGTLNAINSGVDVIHKDMKPRFIPTGQWERLVQTLSEQPGHILIYSMANDAEGYALANQLGQLAKQAGWDVQEISSVIGFAPVSGVEIQMKEIGTNGSTALIKALQISEISSHTKIFPSFRSNEIHLMIGNRQQ